MDNSNVFIKITEDIFNENYFAYIDDSRKYLRQLESMTDPDFEKICSCMPSFEHKRLYKFIDYCFLLDINYAFALDTLIDILTKGYNDAL
jgi:hypothetical protein